ncbi:double-stranded RNA-specific adenosine deaminase-like [Pecten maximus]|uniref:double-stranded RNA-specific adenosine deaminase-like n=1 Tax=Pecten maximus TaxID=6579 RepID=UPI001457FB1B|nr:double-stranded RNA-specific adenosine deaminase-like [Pecten maximus]
MAERWRESLENMNKNCISRLQEYAAKRGLEVEYKDTISSHGGFRCDVSFKKFIASGTGRKVKEAKEAAADQALRFLYKDSGRRQHPLNPLPISRRDDDLYTRQHRRSSDTEENETDSKEYETDSEEYETDSEEHETDSEEYETEPKNSTYAVAKYSSFAPMTRRPVTPAWDDQQPVMKNPVGALMEYAQARRKVARFEEEAKLGPPHCPTYTMRAYIGDSMLAEGTDGSKDGAKRKAAEASLDMLEGQPSRKCLRISPPEPIDKNDGPCPPGFDPISVLNEYAQKSGLELSFPDPDVTGPDHERIFTYQAKIGNKKYARASESTKKEAKREACRNALRSLKRKKLYNFQPGLSTFRMSEPLTFHDKIAKLCHEKFDTVVADIPDNLAGRKVIAGVVMESKSNKTFEIISLASGNRFIRGDALTTDGQVLVDSHAEILASRGMKRLFYHHIKKLCMGQKSNVLQRRGQGKAELQSGIEFHLYISTAPCGDGATFTPSAGLSVEENGHNPTFDNDKQGLLRTKIEQGEGQIPFKKKQVSHQYQSMDAVRCGERLRVMSCSDKLCKWNFLGVQGALLANMMEPVYLSSITLGTLYNHGHMARAMCCRLEKNGPIESLPHGYKVNHPLLGAVSRKDDPKRSVGKSTAHSINWNSADDCPEMTDGTTGLLHNNGFIRTTLTKTKSRLCKQELLRSYKEICTDIGIRTLVKNDYLKTKKTSTQYQRCKKSLYAALHSQGYGTWLGLPRECQEFSTSPQPLSVVCGI